MNIGLTGGIASGKTTAANYLQELGAKVISADEISREIMKKGRPAWQKVVEEFGRSILKEDGELDRSRLGKIVFNDSSKLKLLEKITHPLIINEMEKKIAEIRKQDEKANRKLVIVLEIPLLFEIGLMEMVDQVWVVFVDQSTQIERVMERDGLSPVQARSRIEAQIPMTRKKELADVVIDNTSSRVELKNRINNLWQQVIKG